MVVEMCWDCLKKTIFFSHFNLKHEGIREYRSVKTKMILLKIASITTGLKFLITRH